MTIYADTSFFVALYLEDVHSGSAQALVASSPRVWYTPLHHAEWMHAIAQQVFRRRLAATDAEQIYRALERDRIAGVWAETPMPEGVFDVCASLAREYGPKLGTRTLGSLHVACALQLKAESFYTFDDRQAKLAKTVGLKLT